MKIAIICPYYVPQTTSCAVQIRDLAKEFLAMDYDPIVLTPSKDFAEGGRVDVIDGVTVYRLTALKIENVNLFRRTIAEILMPVTMFLSLCRAGLAVKDFKGIIWYSPSIFFGPIVWYMKLLSKSKGYLILRDMFPEWAVDLAIMKKGPAYYFFKSVAAFQYSVADTIGVQSDSNLHYLSSWATRGRRIEVLSNWLAPSKVKNKTFSFDLSKLAGRKLFVYIGNMGIAQGMEILISLAASLKDRSDLGFVFVGRGSEKNNLIRLSETLGLDNILFHDEIPPDHVRTLLNYCDVGLLALDPRHKSHNIPGKFLAYVESGLPVLARLNTGTDLCKIMEEREVGAFYSGSCIKTFSEMALSLIEDDSNLAQISVNCLELYNAEYLPARAAEQILDCIENKI